jgi:methyl-accepting chemotaxis protein
MSSVVLLDIGLVALAGVIVLVAVYWRFGSGLASRVFGTIVPIAVIDSIISTVNAGLELGSPRKIAGLMFGIFLTVYLSYRLHRVVVVALSEKAAGLQASTVQLGATSRETAATSSQQAAMVAQVTTTIQEIQATSVAAADNAKAVLTDASEALRVSREGRDAVAEARRIMDLIGQVTSVVDTVSELAEKSNLLAVNASIEAAKAGEHGRGFAVVAAEVRNLAEQSKSATRQIRDAIQRTEQGRRAVDTAAEVITRLSKVLDETTDKARGIAGATQQQAAGIQQITDAMTSVAEGAQSSAATARQIEQAVHDLEKLATEVRTFVNGERRFES